MLAAYFRPAIGFPVTGFGVPGAGRGVGSRSGSLPASRWRQCIRTGLSAICIHRAKSRPSSRLARSQTLAGPQPGHLPGRDDQPVLGQAPLELGLARFADPQPDLGHQLGSGVVPGGRGELPASRQLAAPPGEQRFDLRPGRRNPQGRVLRAARPVHLVDRALDHPPGHPMDLDLVPQLQEQEVRAQRLRAPQPGATRRSPQHLPEVRVGVGRLHLPQRPTEPGPHLLQVPDVPADRAVRQPRRGPRQHEPPPARRSRTAPAPPPWPAAGHRAAPVRQPAPTRAPSPSPRS